MVIFPLAPDQTIAQMWSNGARGAKIKPKQQAKKTANIVTYQAK